MKHPSRSTLALYAGQDLGWWTRRQTERHVAGCRECRDEVEAFSALSGELSELNELPAISWNRMAAEMRANIRLGLEAGECVRTESAASPWALLTGGRAMVAYTCVMALMLAGVFLERPAPVVPPPPVIAEEGATLRATANGIELNQNGQSISLLHARAADVTYSAGAQGSMRARYVDSDTGNVTINNVYVQ